MCYIFLSHCPHYYVSSKSSPSTRNGMVSFDHVMKLRNTLDKLNRIKGLTHVEQGEWSCACLMYACLYNCNLLTLNTAYLNFTDPEEFLNLLFKHVLKLTEWDAFICLKK